jgi:hypothetical protein
LAKKGYSRTEAMLRMESANQEIDGRPLPPLGEDARPKYRMGFGKTNDSASCGILQIDANRAARFAQGLG